ncbi:MAG: N-acetyltransferase [Gammaproteobacteria bacterium]|jgi:hypothetical protein
MQQNRHELLVRAVQDGRALRHFLRLPQTLYARDPHWIAPLRFEQRQRYGKKNPFFQHARWASWVAYRAQKAVGRISAQIDQLHLDRYRDGTGHFGSLEAEDDPQVFQALFQAAESWLRDEGMRRVTGPFNLSINEECGLLVDGFDTPPCVMMGHARPYYGRHIEALGFGKVRDLFAYRIAPDFDVPRVMRTLADKAADRVRVRPLNRQALTSELQLLRDIFNDAWSENWGFVPFTEAEFNEVGKAMTLLLDDDFVQIAEVEGEPAAMIIALPNVNEAIGDLQGRLLPFGWARLLWRLKVRYPQSARIPLMGVRKRYQRSRLGPTLAFMVIDALRAPVMRRGVREVEMSWILEDNSAMRGMIESLGGMAYKRYRIYEKQLRA